jgi:hypothetical protein
LLAAAHETGLITTLTAALPTPAPTTRLGRMGRETIRMLLLTLLFLAAAGLRRTWDLRSYTGVHSRCSRGDCGPTAIAMSSAFWL